MPRSMRFRQGPIICVNQTVISLQAYNGWREGRVPTVVIVITDGMSQDADLLPQATRDLLEKSTRVIAIGIGSDVNGGELAQIATRPAAANVIVAEDFQSLDFEVDAILNRVSLSTCRKNTSNVRHRKESTPVVP